MSRKRKRLRKLIMGRRWPRDAADALIQMGTIWGLTYADMIREVDSLAF